MVCFLCLQLTDTETSFDIFEGIEEGFIKLDVSQIIEKYFWFKPTKDNSLLCQKCWNTIKSFYIFCLQIEEHHKKITKLKEVLNNENEIKVEMDDADSRSVGLPDHHNDYDEDHTEEIKSVLSNKNEEKSDISDNDDKDVDDDYKPLVIINKAKRKYTKRTEKVVKAKKPKILPKPSTKKIEVKKDKNLENGSDVVPIKRKRDRSHVLRTADAVDEKIAKYMSLDCDICTEVCSSLAALKVHFRLIHQKKGYAKCCNKKFFKRYLLVDHIDCHLNPDHFKCQDCDKTFSVAECLRKHVQDIHKSEKITYYCDQCPKKFIRKSILQRHKAYHTPIETWSFKCTECEKVYPSKFYLSSHTKFSHNLMPKKVCYVCAKDIPTNRYKKHMLEHDTTYVAERVECEICKAKLHKKYIKIHMQHHKEAEVEDFICTICSHKSPNRRALYIHMRYTHAEQRNHECYVCGKAFKRKLALRQHMGTHTGNNLYQCPYCPKTFTYDSNFYIHKKKEHPKEIELERERKKRTNFVKHNETMNKLETDVVNNEVLEVQNTISNILSDNVDVKVEIYKNF